MNPIAYCAAEVLRDHPHPAVRLSELLELVAERVDRTLNVGRLRCRLEEHPERFHILDPGSGPWRAHRGDRSEGYALDPLVLMSEAPAPDGLRAPADERLRNSVRWLAGRMHGGSPYRVSRGQALVIAERDARATRRAA